MQLIHSVGKAISRLFGHNASRSPRYCYACPVCGYIHDEWIEPRQHLRFSYDICPCCLNEFGYDDFTKSHEELRQEWIDGGMKWNSDIILPPDGWNPRKQVEDHV